MNKRIFSITIICSMLAFAGAFAQSDEELLITSLNNYLEGGTNGNPEQFKSAFINDAVQRSVGTQGTVIGMTVASLASKIKEGQKMSRTTRIVSWSYADIAATAITETVYPNSKIIDMLNLLKVDGEWKIVTRVYSRLESNEEIVTSTPLTPATATKASGSKTTTKTAATTPAKKKPADDGW